MPRRSRPQAVGRGDGALSWWRVGGVRRTANAPGVRLADVRGDHAAEVPGERLADVPGDHAVEALGARMAGVPAHGRGAGRTYAWPRHPAYA
ncbi:hypothetical protein AB0G71_24515 [Streptomyces sp. NPDC020403]|uniref:hypothetical protein n=1 Tax=unclassified Streptomyces TaxID=2593676 RepID=UPI0033F41355